jgi:hypothetical protein
MKKAALLLSGLAISILAVAQQAHVVAITFPGIGW